MKKAIVPIVMLFVGFIIGYLVFQAKLYLDLERLGKVNFTGPDLDDNKSALAKALDEKALAIYDKMSMQFATPSKPINLELADTLINAYRARSKKWTHLFPLKTIEKARLDGFFIETDTLKKIVDNKKYNGVSFYFAIQDSAYKKNINSRVYTLVYMGAKKNSIMNRNTGKMEEKIQNTTQDGEVYDFINPCPNACGNFVETMDAKIKAQTKSPKAK